jgi:hypothetical protein
MAWRKKARQELGRQLLWEAMCPECREFWNRVLRAVESGRWIDDPPERVSA